MLWLSQGFILEFFVWWEWRRGGGGGGKGGRDGNLLLHDLLPSREGGCLSWSWDRAVASFSRVLQNSVMNDNEFATKENKFITK